MNKGHHATKPQFSTPAIEGLGQFFQSYQENINYNKMACQAQEELLIG